MPRRRTGALVFCTLCTALGAPPHREPPPHPEGLPPHPDGGLPPHPDGLPAHPDDVGGGDMAPGDGSKGAQCAIDGSDYSYSETSDGKTRQVTINGCPNHFYGVDINPNYAVKDVFAMQVPARPMLGEHSSWSHLEEQGGALGVFFSGAQLYSVYGGPMYGRATGYTTSATYNEGRSFDRCGCHSSSTSMVSYHCHGAPSCLLDQLGATDNDHSPQVGWVADGFPLYGPRGPGGVLMKTCVDMSGFSTRPPMTDSAATPCLDECGGRAGDDPDDGYAYRYYVQGEYNDGKSCKDPLDPLYAATDASRAGYYPFSPICYKGCCPSGATCTSGQFRLPACSAAATDGIVSGAAAAGTAVHYPNGLPQNTANCDHCEESGCPAPTVTDAPAPTEDPAAAKAAEEEAAKVAEEEAAKAAEEEAAKAAEEEAAAKAAEEEAAKAAEEEAAAKAAEEEAAKAAAEEAAAKAAAEAAAKKEVEEAAAAAAAEAAAKAAKEAQEAAEEAAAKAAAEASAKAAQAADEEAAAKEAEAEAAAKEAAEEVAAEAANAAKEKASRRGRREREPKEKKKKKNEPTTSLSRRSRRSRRSLEAIAKALEPSSPDVMRSAGPHHTMPDGSVMPGASHEEYLRMHKSPGGM